MMQNANKKDLHKKVFLRSLIPITTTVILILFYGIFLTQIRTKLSFNWDIVLKKGFFSVGILILAYWLKILIFTVIKWYAHQMPNKTYAIIDNEFLPLIKKISGLLVWIIAICIILSYIGINISALVATLGVGSLAIALAAQDTISNIIAGFLIMIDRPFNIGDEIKLPSGEKVTVIEIGTRRSKFHNEDGAEIIVPNLDISKSKIINYSRSKD